jgi:hypothetical protein
MRPRINMNEDIVKIYDSISQNCIFFLRKAVNELPIPTEPEMEKIGREKATLTCIFVQFALELGIKARVIQVHGIREVLDQRRHGSDTEA